jgi:hypothetical protein
VGALTKRFNGHAIGLRTARQSKEIKYLLESWSHRDCPSTYLFKLEYFQIMLICKPSP